MINKFIKERNCAKIPYLILCVSMFVITLTSNCDAKGVSRGVEESNTVTLGDVTKYMDYLTARDAIISQNLANSDTPGYQPLDLAPYEEQNRDDRRLKHLKLKVTHPGHLKAEPQFEENPYKIVRGKIFERKPNKNAVTREYELMQKGETAQKIKEMGNLYNRQRNMLKFSITGNK